MGSSPSPPPAPDPAQTAEAQGAANIDAAEAQQVINSTNQITPYGSITYKETGGSFVPTLGGGQQYIPQYTATTALTPEMQALFNQNLANSQQSANTAGALGKNVAGDLSKNVDLGPNSTAAYLDTLNRQTLDPQWAQAQTALNQQLANQGLTPGSEGWKYQQTQFGLNKANAYNDMYLRGQNTAVQDILAQYNEPLNALNALQTQSQVSQPGVGSLAPTPQEQIQPAPYANEVNSIYGNQTQQYDAQVAANAQEMGGLFGLGGSLISGLGKFASDERMKTDVQPMGRDPKTGVKMAAYRYRGDPKSYPKTVGPQSAQQVRKQYPRAVSRVGNRLAIEPRVFGLGRVMRRAG
jgi:hypothetical protein